MEPLSKKLEVAKGFFKNPLNILVLVIIFYVSILIFKELKPKTYDEAYWACTKKESGRAILVCEISINEMWGYRDDGSNYHKKKQEENTPVTKPTPDCCAGGNTHH